MSHVLDTKPVVVRASMALAVALLGLTTACRHGALEQEPSVTPRAEYVGLAEATAMVRAQIFEEKPTMNQSIETPLVELTTDEMSRRLGVQVFQVTEGVRACASYLVFGGRAHLLCGGIGGHGIQSMCVTDLDGDGAPELTYTYSWGSGIHRSLVGVVCIEDEGLLREEAPLAFVGDLFVRKESDSRVIVEIGRYGREFSSWTLEAQLGVIEVVRDGSRLRPRIERAPLSEAHTRALWIRQPEGSKDGE